MVRAQYHFRMSPEGFCAWDVRRLIELTRSFPALRVALTEIRELDGPYWAGEWDKPMTCRAVVDHARQMQEVDLAHPVILSSDGRVMDGMHRICKALLEEGIYINPVLRPAAAQNLLRISCTAAHTENQVEKLISTLVKVSADLGVEQ